MRKIITLLISTIILGTAFSPGTKAMFVEEGANWWSFDEMLDYYYEMESQQEAECHGDFDCNMRFEEEHYENDEKYRAMHSLPERQFLLTAINPVKETIKVFLFGQDMMLKRMGIEENLSPDSLYISWIEDPNTWGYAGHTMFDKNTEIDGDGWLPVDTEVELSVAGSNLNDSPTGRLGYSIFAGFFNAQGGFNYASCLTDPDYYEGAECKIAFSAEKGTRYYPPKALALETPNNTEPEDTGLQNDISSVEMPNEDTPLSFEPDIDDTDQSTELPYENEDATTPATTPASASDIAATATTSATSEPTHIQEGKNQTADKESPVKGELKAPETGTFTASDEHGFEFPWWLGVLLGINGLILAWLFWPEFKRK